MTSASGVESAEHLAVVPIQSESGRPSSCWPAGFNVRTMPSWLDDEQTGGHAGDDLAAETLRRLRARLHRALLRAHLLQRVFHRRGHERGLAPPSAPRAVARAAAKNLADREREDARERRDDRSQTRRREPAFVMSVEARVPGDDALAGERGHERAEREKRPVRQRVLHPAVPDRDDRNADAIAQHQRHTGASPDVHPYLLPEHRDKELLACLAYR